MMESLFSINLGSPNINKITNNLQNFNEKEQYLINSLSNEMLHIDALKIKYPSFDLLHEKIRFIKFSYDFKSLCILTEDFLLIYYSVYSTPIIKQINRNMMICDICNCNKKIAIGGN